MKLNGQKIEGPNVEIIVIPRGGDREDIVFHAKAIVDRSAFDKFCPVPQPPERIMKGGKREQNYNDDAYKAQMAVYGNKWIAWMAIESLSATPGLEWDIVKPEDHTTWLKLDEEFKQAGFSHIEIQRIQSGVYTANCLNEARLEEARKSFLSGAMKAQGAIIGQADEPSSTPSGELASAST